MKKGKHILFWGIVGLIVFVIWTVLIQVVDVQPVGQNGTDIGFAEFNSGFHKLTGVSMTLYTVTDWLGLVPIGVCMVFAVVGLSQWIRRRSIVKVDRDILILGLYYVIVILGYLVFEMIPINYRPIPIDGIMEASYPSSTTLLVLSVMPTLMEQGHRRIKAAALRLGIDVFAILFSAFMVIGRLISGVHWFTDIAGAVFLSAGLFGVYKAAVVLTAKEKNQ